MSDTSNKNNQALNTGGNKPVIKFDGKDHTLLNGPINISRKEIQGDGITLRTNGAALSLTQPGEFATFTITGSASGIATLDTFTRPDDDVSMGSPDIGIAWQPVYGEWGVTAHQGYVSNSIVTTSGFNLVLTNEGITDFSNPPGQTYGHLSVTVGNDNAVLSAGSGSYEFQEGGLAFRAKADASFYSAFLPYNPRNELAETYRVIDVLSGVVTTVFDTGIASASGDVIDIILSVANTQINLNGTLVFSGGTLIIPGSTYCGLITRPLFTVSDPLTGGPLIPIPGCQTFDDYSFTFSASPSGVTTAVTTYGRGVTIETSQPTPAPPGVSFPNHLSKLIANRDGGLQLIEPNVIVGKQGGAIHAYVSGFTYDSKSYLSQGLATGFTLSSTGMELAKNGITTMKADFITGDFYQNGGGGGGGGGSIGGSGWSGISGAFQSGWSGLVGTQGYSGWSGLVGAVGLTGSSGWSGWSGNVGISGYATPFTPTKIARIFEEFSSSSNAGTLSAGAWNIRQLNTLDDNAGIGVSLSGNVFTLPVGSYYVEASAPALGVSAHRIRLYNLSTSAVLVYGKSEYADVMQSSDDSVIESQELSITGSAQQFRLEHWATTTIDGSAGQPTGIPGVNEVYASVLIYEYGLGGSDGESGWSGISGNGNSGWSGISGSFSSGWSGISGQFQSGWSGIVGSIGPAGSSGWSGVSGLLQSGWSGASGKAQSGWSGISGNFSSGWSGVSGQFQSGWSGISGDAQSGWSGISGVFQSGWSGVSGQFQSGWSGISGQFQSGWSGVSGNAQSGWSGISGTIALQKYFQTDGLNPTLNPFVDGGVYSKDAIAIGSSATAGLTGAVAISYSTASGIMAFAAMGASVYDYYGIAIGFDNKVLSGGYNSIFGGGSNKISTYNIYGGGLQYIEGISNAIFGGGSNSILGSVKSSSIISGDYCILSGGPSGSIYNSVIVGGNQNVIQTHDAASLTSLIYDSATFGGNYNTIQSSNGNEAIGDLIFSSDNSTISESKYSTIIGGSYVSISGLNITNTTVVSSSHGNASGSYELVQGYYTSASAFAQTSLGRYNTTRSSHFSNSTPTANLGDVLLSVGCGIGGAGSLSASDAFLVYDTGGVAMTSATASSYYYVENNWDTVTPVGLTVPSSLGLVVPETVPVAWAEINVAAGVASIVSAYNISSVTYVTPGPLGITRVQLRRYPSTIIPSVTAKPAPTGAGFIADAQLFLGTQVEVHTYVTAGGNPADASYYLTVFGRP